MQLNTSLQQIIMLVKGTSSLDQHKVISGIASLEDAGPDDLAVVLDRGDNSVFDPVQKDKIARSKAGAILSATAVTDADNYIIVDDPLHAYSQIVKLAQQKDTNASGVTIHETACVAQGVELGDGVQIGAHVVIEQGAHIGAYTQIMPHAFVGARAVIGDSCVLHPQTVIAHECVIGNNSILHAGVIIGSDGFGYQVGSTGLRKIPQIGIVDVGSYVEIGAHTCIDRATFEKTTIGDGVKIDNLVHIAHNVSIGASSAILAHTSIAGGVVIEPGCQIGGQVAIRDHITIGAQAKIVSKSAVLRDVPAGETVCGQPAIPFNEWKRAQVIQKKINDNFSKIRKLLQPKPSWVNRFFSAIRNGIVDGWNYLYNKYLG